MLDVKEGYNVFTGDEVKEPLILKPEDWKPEEWKTLCRAFGHPERGTGRIVVHSTKIESYITPPQLTIVVEGGAVTEAFTNLDIGEEGVNVTVIDMDAAKIANDEARTKAMNEYETCKRMVKSEELTRLEIANLI